MDGVLIIDKPKGPTSHDVVQIVKRLIGAKKVGHLGTLDPAATGVLPLVVNGATKHAAHLAGIEKIYEFTLRLGVVTNTDDDTGKVLKQSAVDVSRADVRAAIPGFVGQIMQRPPDFSAKKIKGRRAYSMARRGVFVDIESRPIQINNLCITGGYIPNVNMKLECRSGTYVRSLCRDIGEVLGCGAHAAGIRRLRSGKYTIDEAIPLDELRENPEIWRERLISI